jgi:hypothetical protein
MENLWAILVPLCIVGIVFCGAEEKVVGVLGRNSRVRHGRLK